jgi:hypothetical protein
MFVGYIYNAEGNYHSRIYLKTIEDSLELVYRFKDMVPRILITESDESVVEVEAGVIVHPHFSEEGVLCPFPRIC